MRHRVFNTFVRLEPFWMYLLDLGDVSKGKKLFLDRLFISNSLLLPLIPESIWKSWNRCARCTSPPQKKNLRNSFQRKKPNERTYTVKKVKDFPVPSRDGINQTFSGRELLNYSLAGRVCSRFYKFCGLLVSRKENICISLVLVGIFRDIVTPYPQLE